MLALPLFSTLIVASLFTSCPLAAQPVYSPFPFSNDQGFPNPFKAFSSPQPLPGPFPSNYPSLPSPSDDAPFYYNYPPSSPPDEDSPPPPPPQLQQLWPTQQWRPPQQWPPQLEPSQPPLQLQPPLPPQPRPLPAGAIVGISVAVVVAFMITLALGILWWRTTHRQASCPDLKDQNLQIGSFTLSQIASATNNFNISNKIGEGGFGPVYKGRLLDGTMIAVKQLSAMSKQGNREFVNELGLISSLKHPHLVKLYGCCTDGGQLLLVYEYMQNNSLAQALFGCQLRLDWPTRKKICTGIAKGLAFLHEESTLKIIHRDIKATNVLLDKNLNPKISDFGLAKLHEEENTHINTRVAGTFGYMAPEYATRGYLTEKADVYSFGVVTFELVSGRRNTIHPTRDKCFYLLDWARVLKEQNSLMELVDPKLDSCFHEEEAMAMLKIALLCTNVCPSARPTMSSVVSMLEGKAAVQELVSDPNDMRKEMSAMWTLIQQNEEIIDIENKVEATLFTDMPSTKFFDMDKA